MKIEPMDIHPNRDTSESQSHIDRVALLELQLKQARWAAAAAEQRAADIQRVEDNENRRAKGQLKNLRARVALADQQAATATHHLQAILSSRTWRVLAPWRRLVALVPPSLRRTARRGLKAGWWAITPWRLSSRLRWLRERDAAARHAAASATVDRHASPALKPSSAGHYAKWVESTEQRSAASSFPASREPMVSFLLYHTGVEEELLRTLDSIRAQQPDAWEVIVCRPGGADDLRSPPHLATSNADPRVVFVDARSSQTPHGLELAASLAKGIYIAVLNSGDVLAPHALNEIAIELERFPETDILYSDEDVRVSTDCRDNPFFKPSWSPELLYAFNYFGRLTLLRRSLVSAAGGLDASTGAAVEWDINLRVSDLAGRIGRITKVLCHRKEGTDGERPDASTLQAADHRSVIEKFWGRHGFTATAATQADGTQRTTWPVDEWPLVSIVIPTKDKVHLLRMCLDGLLCGTEYPNKEIVIVDTGSIEPETRAFYIELKSHPEVRIVRFEKPFNYSAACNYGAACSRGSVLLFLNNDIEIVARDWLQELVRYGLRPGVGVVGTKLVYPTGELQHAGVGVGPHLCALMYRSADSQAWGVFGSADVPRNWLAIMGACQLVRRDAFEQAQGFDESYLVAMSDVALCLKVWRAGFRIAYAPHATLVHHEGATRGTSNPPEDIRRIADDLRRFGIDEDPYLHPELNGDLAIPTLRIDGAPKGREVLAIRIEADGSIPAPFGEFDLNDDGSCLALTDLSRAEVFWEPQPAHRVWDKWSAARWCIDLLRGRADVRRRFAQALSAGSTGAFAVWVKGEGIPPGVSAGPFAAAIDELFAVDIAAQARQTFLFRADVRAAIPHGLTPAGQPDLFRWFMRHGRKEAGLRLEEIWWLFWQAAENPSEELVRAYLFTPSWQMLYPDALTIFGCHAFANWFGSTYRATGRWIDPSGWNLDAPPSSQLRRVYRARSHWRELHPRALEDRDACVALIHWLQSGDEPQSPEVQRWCADLDAPAVAAQVVSSGVNVIGHFCYPSGLRVSVEALVGALACAGIPTSLRDLRTDKKDDPNHLAFDGLEDFDVTIVHTQPEPFFDTAYERADLYEQPPRTYRIAYWYWEFDSIPDEWVDKAQQVDEVWAATEFVAKGLREKLSIPVRTLFPGVKLAPYERRDKAYFGLDAQPYTFLFTFHMMSVMERKNPLGLIRAFKAAFTEAEAVQLVLKTSFGDRHPAQLEELRAAALGANIRIIDQVYSPDEVLSLMDACDAYVSLHRSEGLGLTMAEAMLMGKPVIATNYSGNVDFMDEGNSLLVPYERVRLGRPIPPYDEDAEWAEPSLVHAVECLRRVFRNQAWARELGARARTSAQASLSLEAAGTRIAARLAEIKPALGT